MSRIEYCVYCKRKIPEEWLVDKFVISWFKQVRKNTDGHKLIERVPKERVCRTCYYYEYKDNILTLDKNYYNRFVERSKNNKTRDPRVGWVKGK